MSALRDGNAHPETASTETPEDLQELARRIQEETDSTKMIELVQQLIVKFDESRSRRPHAEGRTLPATEP